MGLQNLVVTVLMVALVVVQCVNCDHDEYHSAGQEALNDEGGFVQRSGIGFILNRKPQYLNGFNAYWLMVMASEPATRSKVSDTFEEATLHGLNLARVFAFNDGSGDKSLQISPGSYDENVFRALDFVVSEAGKYGVRVIMSLVNNWNNLGGKHQYVQWARECGQNLNNDDEFFTNPVVKQYYKNHIKAVLTRNNTINGLKYKDDPTIFAWELMNEPRSPSDYSGKSIQDWVSEMAPYVKSIDSNHLLEVGLEGFYGNSMPEKKQFNPGGVQVGTDFISNNQLPEIDFATIHLYPEQWVGSDEAAQEEFVEKWIPAHIQDSKDILGKPIIISEFGKPSTYGVAKRDSYFGKIYDFIYGSASTGGPCVGGLFWQTMAQEMDSYRDGYEVIFKESPSTANLINQQSQKLSNIG